MITPRTLKGFRDYLPEVMIPREHAMQTARQVFQRFGFNPIDTPALEHLEILTGKGSEETDRQLYHFVDNGGRPVGMRFDLTVPLARFVAQHINTLGTPFKRYHLAPVWRGENTQAGRYREFLQCDFDTVGTDSVVADIETVLVIHQLLQALGIRKFTIHINNRQILTGLLEHLGLASQATPLLRALDKLAKIGPDKTAAEMIRMAGVTDAQARQILALAGCRGTTAEILRRLPEVVGDNPSAVSGTERLRQIFDGLAAAGVPANRLRLDASIARGLDYYTGAIFETFLDEAPHIGSVCSGGRYDNLVGTYSKQALSGVGASLGLDRLLAALESLGSLPSVRTAAPVFLPFFDPHHLHDYLMLASNLRSAGIGVELYPEPKKLGQQLKYADSRGFQVACISGADEFQQQQCQVKDLANKTSQTVAYTAARPEALVEAIQQILDANR